MAYRRVVRVEKTSEPVGLPSGALSAVSRYSFRRIDMLRRNPGQTRCLVGSRIRENADPSLPLLRVRIRRRSSVWIGFIAAAAFAAFAFIGAAQPSQPKTEPPGKARTDQNGDPLPAGALARMGSLRWRHGTAVSYLAFTP